MAHKVCCDLRFLLFHLLLGLPGSQRHHQQSNSQGSAFAEVQARPANQLDQDGMCLYLFKQSQKFINMVFSTVVQLFFDFLTFF